MEPDGERRLGSAVDFEREWLQARALGGGRWLTYPHERPTTQYDLFDHVKAAELDRLLERYQLKNGLVLEYGCGSASMSIYLVNRGFDAVCCDLSSNALELARINGTNHLDGAHAGKLAPVASNALQLPFGNGVFDVVMSYGLLEHFDPSVVDVLLTEVVRTLRPGGLFVADIAHGRVSVRTLGQYLSLSGSLLYHLLALNWKRALQLPRAYLNGLYENKLDERAWRAALERAGLNSVGVRVFHPFPPLALAGALERAYVRTLQRLSPIWQWYDRTQPGWARGWGWLYFVWGVK